MHQDVTCQTICDRARHRSAGKSCINFNHLSTVNHLPPKYIMPKAVSQTFRPATIANPKKRGESSSSAAGQSQNGGQGSTGSAGAGGRNHLFNTERFGQHILTNPAVAQGCVWYMNLLHRGRRLTS